MIRRAPLYYCLGRDRGLPIAEIILRWQQEPVEPALIQCENPADNRERRIRADELSDEPVYIVADDDCQPQDEPFVEEALRILDDHPEFAILSLLPDNASIFPWRRRNGIVPYEDDEVMEHVSVGGVRFCVRGALEVWPEQTGPGYDKEHAEALRANGWRVGYFKHLKMTHLGEGDSTVWT